jgi:hypothetical protein
MHPVLIPNAQDSDFETTPTFVPAVATQLNLLAMSDSMAFAPWLPWSLDVSGRVRQNELYTAILGQRLTATAANAPDFFSASVAGLSSAFRQSCLGCLSASTLTTEATAFVGGIVWMKLSINLIEFCPVSLTAAVPPQLSLRRPKRSSECLGCCEGKKGLRGIQQKCSVPSQETDSSCQVSEPDKIGKSLLTRDLEQSGSSSLVDPSQTPNGSPACVDFTPNGSRTASRVYTLEEVNSIVGALSTPPSGVQQLASD